MPLKFLTNPSEIPPRKEKHKFTVVLDVDETLVHKKGEDGETFVRPFAQEMLDRLASFPHVEIVVWSAGKMVHIKSCLKHFNLPKTLKHAIVRGDEKVWDVKDMSLIGRPFDSVIMVDDRNDTITSFIHFHVSEWKGDRDDTELAEVLNKIIAHIMVSDTQRRKDSVLGHLGSFNRQATVGIFGRVVQEK